MKIMCVEWPSLLQPESDQFQRIAKDIKKDSPEMLITNEMPFGDWVYTVPHFDRSVADQMIQLHESGLAALRSLDIPFVISSRPVSAGNRMANEAFVLEEGHYQILHHKQFFPEHVGWYEASWFHAAKPGFDIVTIGGLKVGLALCTDLMFNEHSRSYGRFEADLIAVPRATGPAVENWRLACGMSALVSGSYVVSSNRRGPMATSDELFGGVGMVYAPGGVQIGETSEKNNRIVFDLDPKASAERRKHYPCNVDERPRIASAKVLKMTKA